MDATNRQSNAKMLTGVIIIALLLLLGVLYIKWSAAEAQLKQLSVRLEQVTGGNQAQNAAAAKAVLDKVSKLYVLPTGVQPTVATIVDVEALRKQNPFYNKAENGDNLIITPDRAILYSPKKNMILDVVPVQLQQGQNTSAAASKASTK